jgi:DNA-binding NtrC family response regulator
MKPGAFGYVIKPVDMDALFGKIRNACEKTLIGIKNSEDDRDEHRQKNFP